MSAENETSDRIRVFGIAVDRIDMTTAIERVWMWCGKPRAAGCRYVVTPNVHHVVQLRSNAELHKAYRSASLVLADGWPLVAASRILRKALPERVTGSDLVPNLFAQASEKKGLRVFLLGGMPGVGERAACSIQDRWPHVDVAGVHSPPLGFEKNPQANAAILKTINAVRPDLLVVGLGAPKQEIWLREYHEQIDAGVAIAAGATIDFLAGEQTRAPHWIQSLCLEWLFRAATNPRRLAQRYLVDAVVFPRILLGEILSPGKSLQVQRDD